MKPTRRGWFALVVVAAAVGNAVAFGPRALNAVVVPVVVALVVSAIQLRRLSQPRVSRTPVDDGFPDERRTVSLSFDASPAFPARITDSLSEGLAGDSTVETVVGDDPVTYEVEYLHRGRQTLGPTTLVAYDVLGFFSRRFEVSDRTDVLVFPRLRALSTPARRTLARLSHSGVSDERGEFDRLRGYVHGDPLRDIHWKSSAKSDDLMVKAFTDRTDPSAVQVSVGSVEGSEDDVAEAAAAVCCSLLELEIPIELSTPVGTLDAVSGSRRHVLSHLAQLHPGSVPEPSAEVVVRGERAQTTIILSGREFSFEQLREDGGVKASLGGRSASEVVS
ncbi:DUF58 domain-containing protein [Haloferax namakaokahaiae]|uniref:DUF58 domain-containing protein n=1 Tax=Haloferax namakaokahaiae TaxID=1748331 RepID=A0ABD5ZC32_9EURY